MWNSNICWKWMMILMFSYLFWLMSLKIPISKKSFIRNFLLAVPKIMISQKKKINFLSLPSPHRVLFDTMFKTIIWYAIYFVVRSNLKSEIPVSIVNLCSYWIKFKYKCQIMSSKSCVALKIGKMGNSISMEKYFVKSTL